MQRALLTEFIDLSLDLEYIKNPRQRTRSEDIKKIIFERNLLKLFN